MLGINDIITFILSNDLKYTGFHQYPSERTKPTCLLLEAPDQMKLVWKEFNNYLLTRLREGNAVKIPNFGVFTFSNTNNIKFSDNKNFTMSFTNINSFFKQKLIFQIGKNYRNILKHFPDEKLNKKILQPIEYLEPKKFVDWNPYGISKKCCLKDIVVRDCINAIFQAIFDLVKCGKNINIEIGPCKFIFDNGEMKYTSSL